MRQVSFSETNNLSLHLVSSCNTSSPLVLHISPLFLVLSGHYVSRCAGSLSASLVRWDQYHSLRQPFEKLGCWIHLHSFLFLREKLQVVCLLTMQSHVTTSHPHTLICFPSNKFVFCSPQAFNWFRFHQGCKWVKTETSLSISPVSLKAGALDACSIFLSSSLGSHYKQGHLSWHLFVSSWRGNWCGQGEITLIAYFKMLFLFLCSSGELQLPDLNMECS